MQERRSNRERTDATRASLLQAARALFVRQGYAVTSTPGICAAAGITRGALYHHFVDKQDLFRAVLEQEAAAVRADIETAAPAGASPQDALINGAEAYLDAMTLPGRTRLLLIEGPAVLGLAALRDLDERNAAGSLVEGLRAAGVGGDAGGPSLAALAALLSAAFDRAALDIDAGADARAVRKAMRWLLLQTLPTARRVAVAAARSRPAKPRR
jgi:AcrR family transcriptional regulator